MTTTEPTTPGALSPAKRALLEQRLRRSARAVAPGIPRRPDGEAPPLSYAQERLWFMEQFAPGTGAYGTPLLVRLGPDADLAALGDALRALTARHESLRMSFPATEDGRPLVVVAEPAGVDLPVTRVAGEAELSAAVDRLADRPFDLAHGPLLRPHVLRVTEPAGTAVLLDLHHIVTDGWSNDVLLTDLAELYAAARERRPARLGDPGRYGDFAAWQREQMAGPGARAHLDHWLARLRGVPPLELPADAPRPAVQTFGGDSYRFVLPARLAELVTALGRAHRATPFMTLLAAYQAVLGRWSGQADFAVGSPVAGRGHPDLDGMVGMFNNMLPLRADLSGDPTGAELVERVRDTVLDALAHQDVPFEKVVNDLGVVRDVSRPALFQAMFALQNYEMKANAEGALPWRPVDLPATRFDLELHAFTGPDGDLHCRFVYNTALFRAGTVARLAGSLTTLLGALLDRPDVPVADLDLLGAADRALLEGWNATAAPADPDATLPGLVAAQVARTPAAPAVADRDRTLSYAELDAAANRVANRLRTAGIGVGDVVAVCAQRSADLVVALLGVQKAGAAYVPLDPDYPADRLAFMLADSGAAALLTQRALVDALPPAGGVLLLDDPAAWTDRSTVDPGVSVPAGAPAYLIYTSGSTGRPKGVPNAHRGIVNRLAWMQDRFSLGPGDVVLQKTPASFDVSVWEFFWPLLTGATLVLAKPGGHRDPAYLRELIDRHGVTTVHFVPSMLAAFLAEAEPGACPSLRRIVCSGEELPLELASRCLAALPHAELHNLYGPTEAAVDVTAYECTPAGLAGLTRVPIGAPVPNTTVHVLDPRGARVPVGAVGELHLGGVQVALGYHRRPGLTARRFVPDPYGPPGSRLYATGDLARWRDDGTVEFLGRIDGQVKLRGLRIELGEIEAALRDQPGVADAAAAVKDGPAGDKRLVGYLVGDADPAALREALRKRLPDYMVPAAFVPLERLPLSPAGKLDRKTLPDPAPVAATTGFVEPATDDERAIAAVWREVLGRDTVGAQDDFFALGGHSLLATQVVAKLRPLTADRGRRVGVMDLFQHPTVRGLAALIGTEAEEGPPRLLYELTRPVPDAQRICSYVCVPYGGGSAVVYQPVADLLPAGHSLWSVGIPGHDIGLDDEGLAFDELVERCTREVLERVPPGPLVLYGHCGVGGAVVTELARRLEAAGRELDAVYAGGVFPFARPAGRLARFHTWLEDRASNRGHQNWMKSMGVDMADVEPEQADRIISTMRRDSKNAEEHFTELLAAHPAKLAAPFVSVVGERDPITDYYQERYREWRFLTDTAAVVVLDEAGHFFLRYRAQDVADIITGTHVALAEHPGDLDTVLPVRDRPPPRDDPARPRWWVEGVARAGADDDPGAPDEASMRRFAVVAFGQLVSSVGSALTGWAIPVWLYLRTGSLALFGLTGVLAVVPMLLATPVAGAVADRYDRRRVIMASSVAVLALEAVFALLLARGDPPLWTIYVLVWLLSSAGTFQRIAFTAAIPQLAPKRFLGHANGVAQLINGVALLFVPVLAAGLLATIGLGGILALDIVSYVFAIAVLAFVRFPDLLGRRRKETFSEALFGGWRLTWDNPSFRAMLFFFGIGNLLYAAPVLLVAPLVLSFAGTAQVGQVAVAEGLGALAGGLAMAIWGGPRRSRMRANILAIALSGFFVAVTGLRPSLPVVLAGVLGTALSLSIANGLYMTIIQVKVPQRFHGRVFALNQTITWSTLPIGFAVLVPASGALDRLLTPDGVLASTVGRVIGTGEGRGLGLAYLVFGIGMMLNALVALRVRRLARLDTDLPDSLPDDLVGVRLLAERAAGRAEGGPVASGRAALPGTGGPARPDAGPGRHRE
ncbi:MAG TPA: amino acid adenylation domain-containing protein [Mycobacteriales bacterium]